MQEVTTKEQIQDDLNAHEMVVLYFTGSTCGACQVIRSKLEAMLRTYPYVKGIEVNGVKYPHIAADYGVFTLPIFILFVRGKEVVRESKHVDLLNFEERIARYQSMLEE